MNDSEVQKSIIRLEIIYSNIVNSSNVDDQINALDCLHEFLDIYSPAVYFFNYYLSNISNFRNSIFNSKIPHLMLMSHNLSDLKKITKIVNLTENNNKIKINKKQQVKQQTEWIVVQKKNKKPESNIPITVPKEFNKTKKTINIKDDNSLSSSTSLSPIESPKIFECSFKPGDSWADD